MEENKTRQLVHGVFRTEHAVDYKCPGKKCGAPGTISTAKSRDYRAAIESVRAGAVVSVRCPACKLVFPLVKSKYEMGPTSTDEARFRQRIVGLKPIQAEGVVK